VDAAAVRIWRRAQRQRLLALRAAAPPAQRGLWSRAIEAALWDALAARPPGVIGVYWPFRGEFDPRPLFDRLIGLGWRPALPAVIDKKGPLEYRLWRPGEPLVTGVWDIPVPEKRDVVLPQTVLAPLVGFDPECYRLGYGGGYFDRTLAAAAPRPLAVGVGFEFSRLDTIRPQPFDMPMDLIVTEAGSHRRRGSPCANAGGGQRSPR
jgi:5-formyltetrahydrofolate cyclo-ligase